MGNVWNKTTKAYLSSVNTPEYPASDWLVNPAGAPALVAAGVPSSEWKEDPAGNVREMTAAEKDSGLLGAKKYGKIMSLKNAVSRYVETKYDGDQQITITALYAEGVDRAWIINRRPLAQGIMDWVNAVLAEFYTRKNAVLAAATVAAVAAISEDFSAFNATVPATTIEQLKNAVS